MCFVLHGQEISSWCSSGILIGPFRFDPTSSRLSEAFSLLFSRCSRYRTSSSVNGYITLQTRPIWILSDRQRLHVKKRQKHRIIRLPKRAQKVEAIPPAECTSYRETALKRNANPRPHRDMHTPPRPSCISFPHHPHQHVTPRRFSVINMGRPTGGGGRNVSAPSLM